MERERASPRVEEQGDDQHVPFRTVAGIAAYVPLVQHPSIAAPLLACPLDADPGAAGAPGGGLPPPRQYLPTRQQVDGSERDPTELCLADSASARHLSAEAPPEEPA